MAQAALAVTALRASSTFIFRVNTPELENERDRFRHRASRVEVRGQGDGRAGVDEGPGGRALVLTEEEGNAGEENRDRPARREGPDPGLGDRDQVFRGDGSGPGRKLGAAQRRELIGMDLDSQAGRRSRLDQPF